MSKEIENQTKTPENEKSSQWPFLIPQPNTWHPILKTIISCFGLLVCIVIAIGIVFLLYDILSLYFSSDKDDRFSYLRSSLLILAALIGAPFLVWRTWLASEQTKTAEHQAEIARDRSYTELFTKAVEQLGSEKPAKKETELADGSISTSDMFVPNIEVRIGAIFALERIMHDSKKDAEAIVDTLAAYVRENCGKAKILECEVPKKETFETTGTWLHEVMKYVGEGYPPKPGTLVARAHAFQENTAANRSDIQTALTVIGRRPKYLKNGKKMPSLFGNNLQGSHLTDFDFRNCNLSFSNMEGSGLHKAQMQKANLNHAHMHGAHLVYVNLKEASLNNAKLIGTNLYQAILRRANMNEVNAQGANLFQAEMQGVKLAKAKLQSSNLFAANMQGADLFEANMQGSDVTSANMLGANLEGVKIEEVSITSAYLKAASVLHIDFTRTNYESEILKTQLEEMFGHKEHTKLPDGFTPPKHWSRADMNTDKGRNQYNQEWEAFKKKMGVE